MLTAGNGVAVSCTKYANEKNLGKLNYRDHDAHTSFFGEYPNFPYIVLTLVVINEYGELVVPYTTRIGFNIEN